VSVVVPARNEERTVGQVVRALRAGLLERGLAAEIVVIDSDSEDDTGAVARAAGATVRRSGDIRPDLGTFRGKGEALWKAQFATAGEILLFVDADLLEVDAERIACLLDPLLGESEVALVRARYSRVYRQSGQEDSLDGGRLTELCARPLINMWWPELAHIEQPLAGEWAIRRSVFERLHVPVGYGVELSTLLDVYRLHGRGAIAQVDLGRRVHRHRRLVDLGATAAELLAVAAHRLPGTPPPGSLDLLQFPPGGGESGRRVPISTRERPPGLDVREPARAVVAAGSC
jgi:glucosyl-3-phosphoglycerate synthase